MSVETFDVSTDVLSVTPEAARHLKTQVEAKGFKGVRISVKESGCSGYMYVMEEVSDSQAEDVTVALDNGVSVFMDAGFNNSHDSPSSKLAGLECCFFESPFSGRDKKLSRRRHPAPTDTAESAILNAGK